MKKLLFVASIVTCTALINASEFDIKKIVACLDAPVQKNVVQFLAHSTLITSDNKKVFVSPQILEQCDFFKRYLKSPVGQTHRSQGLAIDVPSDLVIPFITLLKKQYTLSHGSQDPQKLVRQLFLFMEENPQLACAAFDLIMLADQWDNHIILQAVAAFIAHHADANTAQNFIKLPIHIQQIIITQSPLFIENITGLLMLLDNLLSHHKLNIAIKQALIDRMPDYAQFLAQHSKALLKNVQLTQFLTCKSNLADALRAALVDQYGWLLITELRKFNVSNFKTIKLSSDQKYLVVNDKHFKAQNIIYNIRSGKLEKTIKWPTETRSYMISPDMSYAVTIFTNNSIVITYFADNTMQLLERVPAGAYHLIMSKDSNYIMTSSGTAPATTTIWDRDGNVINIFDGNALDLSPDGSQLIIMGRTNNNIEIIDSKTKEVIQQLSNNPSVTFSYWTGIFPRFTDNGKAIITVASGPQYSAWQVWDIATGNLIKQLPYPYAYGYNMSIDMQYILKGDNKSSDITLIDSITDKALHELPFQGHVIDMSKDYVVLWKAKTFFITPSYDISILGIDPKVDVVGMMKKLSQYNLAYIHNWHIASKKTSH